MSKLYRAVYDGGRGGYWGKRTRYGLVPPHTGSDDQEDGQIDRRGPVLVRYAGEAFFRMSCTGNVFDRRWEPVGAWAYPVFGPERSACYVDDGTLRQPGHQQPGFAGKAPPRAIRTVRDAEAWLRAASTGGVRDIDGAGEDE